MTDIQHNEIIKYLEEKGYDCVDIGNHAGDIFIDVMVNNEEMRLKCKFPDSFPYTFPKVYILKEFYKGIAPLPHIDKEGYICTFDSNKSFPNFKKPNELVFECIRKAVEVIEDGINGINRDDFIEEFQSYWGMEEKYSSMFWMLSTPTNKSTSLYYYNDKYKDFYIGDEIEKIKEYLKHLKGLEINNKDLKRCIYLPLTKPWYPPYPKTNKEIYTKVKEESKVFKAYYNSLKNKEDMSIIIFSQEVNGERYLGGWMHEAVKTPNGFRKGKIIPELVYLVHNKDNEVIKFRVNQLDRRRLFNRGGDGNIISNLKVSITGCGSIGSYLTQVLSELSVDNFILIDNQRLTSENIARHMCGASDIGEPKTEAIKEKLIKHYPYIKCKSMGKDVFDVLQTDVTIFNDCDINFVVVGNKPIEAKFIELFNQDKITKPIIIIWVEPFLLGGHAIIMQQNQKIESILYDNEYNFKYSVVENGGNYTRKEAGCESTYIPYSAFEAKQFIYSFLHYFRSNHMTKETEGNYLFSWCGNLKWARKEDIMISDLWLSKQNRTVKIQRLDTYDKV
ncbi:MAG: hypothetical protein FH761_08270 [Firmicutes bacterium]|nr:hypothetical protein [Bacillota bacterium]